MSYLNGKKVLLGANVATGSLTIDQTYSPESENAQSGKAVAQAIKPKKVIFNNNATLTLENNAMYVAETPINDLTIIYPQTDFICSIDFTIAGEGTVSIALPTSRYIGAIPSFENGTTWELNIKNGIVVGGKTQ
ncbi:MAG: hypothetical protein IKK77_00585 [Clostridia bacterium]|nr:hypothetical protein [Clostridia bacterium]